MNDDCLALPESERSDREWSFRWRASQWRTRIFIPFHEGVFTGCAKGAWGGGNWLNEDPVHCRIAKVVKKPSHWEVEVHHFKGKTSEPAWQLDIRHRPDGTFRIVAKRGPNARAGRGWFDLAL